MSYDPHRRARVSARAKKVAKSQAKATADCPHDIKTGCGYAKNSLLKLQLCRMITSIQRQDRTFKSTQAMDEYSLSSFYVGDGMQQGTMTKVVEL